MNILLLIVDEGAVLTDGAVGVSKTKMVGKHCCNPRLPYCFNALPLPHSFSVLSW